MHNKKANAAVPMLFIVFMGLIATVLVGGGIIYAYDRWGGEDTQASIGVDSAGNPVTLSAGVPVESLSVTQINKYTEVTEGGDDVEFWDKGADITDSTKSPREALDLSSGAVTDTSVPNLRSGDTQATKDLYIEGTGNYYDDKVNSWKIDYNVQTGKGALVVDGHVSKSLVATDVGTFSDFDAGVAAVDTGFQDNADGTLTYNITSGDGVGVYFDLVLGNDEDKSDLRGVVLCIGDNDGDLEGDEITTFNMQKQSGNSIGNTPTSLLTQFNEAAGSKGTSCVDLGDIEGLLTGTYRFTISWTEANWAADEEFELIMDDNGAFNGRDYPSRNSKATAEDLVIDRAA